MVLFPMTVMNCTKGKEEKKGSGEGKIEEMGITWVSLP